MKWMKRAMALAALIMLAVAVMGMSAMGETRRVECTFPENVDDPGDDTFKFLDELGVQAGNKQQFELIFPKLEKIRNLEHMYVMLRPENGEDVTGDLQNGRIDIGALLDKNQLRGNASIPLYLFAYVNEEEDPVLLWKCQLVAANSDDWKDIQLEIGFHSPVHPSDRLDQLEDNGSDRLMYALPIQSLTWQWIKKNGEAEDPNIVDEKAYMIAYEESYLQQYDGMRVTADYNTASLIYDNSWYARTTLALKLSDIKLVPANNKVGDGHEIPMPSGESQPTPPNNVEMPTMVAPTATNTVQVTEAPTLNPNEEATAEEDEDETETEPPVSEAPEKEQVLTTGGDEGGDLPDTFDEPVPPTPTATLEPTPTPIPLETLTITMSHSGDADHPMPLATEDADAPDGEEYLSYTIYSTIKDDFTLQVSDYAKYKDAGCGFTIKVDGNTDKRAQFDDEGAFKHNFQEKEEGRKYFVSVDVENTDETITTYAAYFTRYTAPDETLQVTNAKGESVTIGNDIDSPRRVRNDFDSIAVAAGDDSDLPEETIKLNGNTVESFDDLKGQTGDVTVTLTYQDGTSVDIPFTLYAPFEIISINRGVSEPTNGFYILEAGSEFFVEYEGELDDLETDTFVLTDVLTDINSGDPYPLEKREDKGYYWFTLPPEAGSGSYRIGIVHDGSAIEPSGAKENNIQIDAHFTLSFSSIKEDSHDVTPGIDNGYTVTSGYDIAVAFNVEGTQPNPEDVTATLEGGEGSIPLDKPTINENTLTITIPKDQKLAKGQYTLKIEGKELKKEDEQTVTFNVKSAIKTDFVANSVKVTAAGEEIDPVTEGNDRVYNFTEDKQPVQIEIRLIKEIKELSELQLSASDDVGHIAVYNEEGYSWSLNVEEEDADNNWWKVTLTSPSDPLSTGLYELKFKVEEDGVEEASYDVKLNIEPETEEVVAETETPYFNMDNIQVQVGEDTVQPKEGTFIIPKDAAAVTIIIDMLNAPEDSDASRFILTELVEENGEKREKKLWPKNEEDTSQNQEADQNEEKETRWDLEVKPNEEGTGCTVFLFAKGEPLKPGKHVLTLTTGEVEAKVDLWVETANGFKTARFDLYKLLNKKQIDLTVEYRTALEDGNTKPIRMEVFFDGEEVARYKNNIPDPSNGWLLSVDPDPNVVNDPQLQILRLVRGHEETVKDDKTGEPVIDDETGKEKKRIVYEQLPEGEHEIVFSINEGKIVDTLETTVPFIINPQATPSPEPTETPTPTPEITPEPPRIEITEESIQWNAKGITVDASENVDKVRVTYPDGEPQELPVEDGQVALDEARLTDGATITFEALDAEGNASEQPITLTVIDDRASAALVSVKLDGEAPVDGAYTQPDDRAGEGITLTGRLLWNDDAQPGGVKLALVIDGKEEETLLLDKVNAEAMGASDAERANYLDAIQAVKAEDFTCTIPAEKLPAGATVELTFTINGDPVGLLDAEGEALDSVHVTLPAKAPLAPWVIPGLVGCAALLIASTILFIVSTKRLKQQRNALIEESSNKSRLTIKRERS